MDTPLNLTMLSSEKAWIVDLKVQTVFLPSYTGELQILPDHMHLLGILETGIIRYLDWNHKNHAAAISIGFFEVQNNRIVVTAETMEFKEHIDLARAQKAQKISEQNLSSAGLSDAQFKKYELKLKRSLIRQKLFLDSDY